MVIELALNVYFNEFPSVSTLEVTGTILVSAVSEFSSKALAEVSTVALPLTLVAAAPFKVTVMKHQSLPGLQLSKIID